MTREELESIMSKQIVTQFGGTVTYAAPVKLKTKWHGSEECDFCQCDVTTKPYFVDGTTRQGPWACMCPDCFTLHGRGLGTGVGQKYNGRTMEKMEG